MGEESPRPNASNRTSNVQDFVQSILSAVTNLQHSSQVGEEHQLTPNRHGGSVQQQQFASSAEEVNFRFQIPRSNVNSSAPQPARGSLSPLKILILDKTTVFNVRGIEAKTKKAICEHE